MGYYSTIEVNGLILSEGVEPEDFYRDLEGTPFDKYNIYFDRIDNKDYIELNEGYVKFYDHDKVIKALAKYVEGDIEVYGDENTDIWKVEFYGDGHYTKYAGIIDYKAVVIE